MRRLFLFVLCFLSIGISAQTQKEESCNDWQKNSLRGRVKSYTEEKVVLIQRDGVTIKESRMTIETAEYNESGYLLEEINNNDDGSRSYKLTYRYNDKNNIIEKNYYEGESDLPEQTVIICDSKGREIERTDFAKDGSVKYRSIHIYNDKKNTVKEKYCDNGAKDCRIFKKTFDEQGRVIEIKNYKTDGSLYVYKSFAYDKDGKKTEKYIYTAPDYVYMTNNLKIVTFKTCKGNVFEICDWDNTSEDTNRLSFACERDKQGNWIRRTYESEENKDGSTKTTIDNRTIVYY